MSLSTVITPAVLDKIIGLLVPLFLTGTDGDPLTARHAAACMLAAYNAETEEELRLAAEIISFGFGALDALAQSMGPGLTVNAVLRLRGSANAQHRSAHQCQRTLDRVRKERRIAAAEANNATPAPEEPVTAETLTLSNNPTRLTAPTRSRQQRRAAERKAEKIQRKLAERVRREALRVSRLESAPPQAVTLQPQPPNQPLAA